MKIRILLAFLFTVSIVTENIITAQETEESESPFSTGLDIYSSFIWRGSREGSGPAFQPYLEFSKGGFTVGSWGSFDASGYAETDLYAGYEFPFGLMLGVTDYYLCDLDLFDFSDSTGSHALELNAGFEIQGFSFSANCIVNEAGGVESTGGDLYFEAGYSFNNLNIFIGAGNGWHTTDGSFKVCNIGLGTQKDIRVTDSFSIPVSGQVVLNPESRSLYLTVGLSL